MLSEAQEGLEKNSREDKLSFVPGEEILEAVFSKFGLKFSKRKDGSKIAAEMSTPEDFQKSQIFSENSLLRRV